MTVAVKCNIPNIALSEASLLFYGVKCKDNSRPIIENYLEYLNCPGIIVEDCQNFKCDNPPVVFNCNLVVPTISYEVVPEIGPVTAIKYAFTATILGGTPPFTYQWTFNEVQFTAYSTTTVNPLILEINEGFDIDDMYSKFIVVVTDSKGCTYRKLSQLENGVINNISHTITESS